MPGTKKLLLLEPDRRLAQEMVNVLAPQSAGVAAADLRLELSLVSTPAQAVAQLDQRPIDLLLCDSGGLPDTVTSLLDRAIRDTGAIVIVEPGLEEWLAGWLDHRHVDYLLKAGDFVRLLPPLVRKHLTRRELEARLAEMARVVAALRELTAAVRHELNNPLTGVLGNAELVLQHRRGLSAENIRRLEGIVELAVRMRQYLKELHFGLETAALAATAQGKK